MTIFTSLITYRTTLVYFACVISFVNQTRMATAFPQATQHGDDNFVLALNLEKDKVRTTFIELREVLTETEKKLMKALNDILSSYNSYRSEVKKMDERKREIENIRNMNLTFVPTLSDLKASHDMYLQDLNEQLNELQTPVRPKLVRFVCEKNELVGEVNELCKLVERASEIDYKNKTQSIISVCDRSAGNEQLNGRCGVTVDHNTGNIYVADYWNHCIKVFDNTAKYLLKFGDGKGEEKMSHPIGLLIHGNKVFVSHSHCILVYQLDGKFASRIGSRGSGELQFKFPWGLSTDEYNNDIYVCNNGNNLIQIISENLRYKSQFGKDTLDYPRDIKLYKDNIFILDTSNPCLHRYTRDLVLQQSVVTRGGGQQVSDPWFFFIDKFGNILISDRDSGSILVLNSEFEFIHKISVHHPMGIIMDREDRIIVVCSSPKNCLQIF